MKHMQAPVEAPRTSVARVTAIYGACHLVVDLACVGTLLGVAAPALGVTDTAAQMLAIMTYDMVAFCMQLPFGAMLDALGRHRSRGAAILSLLLVVAGVLAPKVPELVGIAASGLACAGASVLLVAIGNALFHCVGGVEVLGESDGKVGPSGAFISTGAIGVFVGGMARFNGWTYAPWMLVGLLVACILGVAWLGRSSDERGSLDVQLTGIGWLAVALLAATVALRSFTGMVMAFPWKVGLLYGASVVMAVVLGKALGGFLADRLGMAFTSLISLGGAAAAFWFSWESVPAGLTGTFLFNFTMAITLGALAHLLPKARGMAFGIASFSLAVGAFPALMGWRVSSALALTALSGASLILLELGLLCMYLADRHREAS